MGSRKKALEIIGGVPWCFSSWPILLPNLTYSATQKGLVYCNITDVYSKDWFCFDPNGSSKKYVLSCLLVVSVSAWSCTVVSLIPSPSLPSLPPSLPPPLPSLPSLSPCKKLPILLAFCSLLWHTYVFCPKFCREIWPDPPLPSTHTHTHTHTPTYTHTHTQHYTYP